MFCYMMNYTATLIIFLLVNMATTSLSSVISGDLVYDYYKESCPLAEEIIQRQVEIAVSKDPRMAASLLRLHFHDCFVMGCDASLLLDDFGVIISEKGAAPNVNSLRGFEVIDKIKYILEEACPCMVSCADVLAIAARDAVSLRGGPKWDVYLGRRDSLKASFTGANEFIPDPNSSLEVLIANFKVQGLNAEDLVALSGSHTMGKARCVSFRQRIYDDSWNIVEYSNHHRYKDNEFRKSLESMCPRSGRDDAVAPLDYVTPAMFDNHYYHNIKETRGLLISDNVLVSQDYGEIREYVWAYASDEQLFFDSFAKSMIKMGNIGVLTGVEGQIRKNCRFLN